LEGGEPLAVVGHAEVIVRAITTGVKRDIQNSFNGLSGVGRKAGQQLGNALTRGIVGSDPGKNAFSKMQAQLREIYPEAERAAEGFTSLMRTSFVLQGVIGGLVGSLSSVVVSIGSLIGAALGAASSLAAVIPIFVAFGVAAIGARLALGGVGEALNEAGGAANRAAENNKRLEESERRLANTVRNSTQQVTRAQERLTDAQENLNEALQQGREELQQLGFDAEDAALAEKRAAIELERARETLIRVQDLPPNSRARREAELAFAEADLNMRRSIDRNSDLRQEQERLAVEGVDGLESVQDAREGVTDAEQALQEAVEDGTRAIEDATRAHEELQEEINNTAGALGGMASAYDRLTPSQKDFVDFLKELKPLMGILKESVAKGFLPDLEDAISRVVNSAFPTVNAGLAEIGDALGDASIKFSEAFEDQTNLTLLSKFFTNNSTLIRKFGDFANAAFGAILGFLEVINPLAQRFLDWIIESTQEFEAFLKTPEGAGQMITFFENAGDMAARFGDIFGNVFGGLGKLVEDSFKPGSGADKLLDWFEKATANFANMDSIKLNKTLSDAADNTILILDAITGVFSIFTDLAGNPGIGQFWANLELSSKAFSELLNEATKVAGPFGALLSTLIQIAAVFADAGQAMAFFETLDFIAGGFLEIFKSLKPLLDVIAPFIGVISAVAFVVGGLGTAVLITTGFAIKAAGIFGALKGIMLGAGVGASAAATGTGLFATALRGLSMANPIGLAITGIVVAVTALATVFNGFQADRLQNASLGVSAAFREGASAADAWSAATENAIDFGHDYVSGSKEQYSSIKNLKGIMDEAGESQKKFNRQGYSTVFSKEMAALASVKAGFQAYGKSLSNLATTDFPQAQAAFQAFRDESNLNTEQLYTLIDSSTEYKDSLIKQAEAYGIVVTDAKGMVDQQALVDFALGEGEIATRKAAEEFKKYNEDIGKAAIANSGFKDSLKDAMSEGEFDTTKFLENMKTRVADAAELVRVKVILTSRGATDEMLAMIDAQGENALKAGQMFVDMSEEDFKEYTGILAREAEISSGAFTDAFSKAQGRTEEIFARLGSTASKNFTKQINSATTVQELARINSEWTKALSVAPVATLSLKNNTGLTADRLERLIGFSIRKDGGLVGKLQKYAYGGFVSGPGGPRSDSIMAMLSDGEFVVNAASTNKYLPLLQAINSGNLSASSSGSQPSAFAVTSSATASSASPTVNIVVNPSQGMNERELASKISRVLALQLRRGSVT
jgi:hypothetical protein